MVGFLNSLWREIRYKNFNQGKTNELFFFNERKPKLDPESVIIEIYDERDGKQNEHMFCTEALNILIVSNENH